ncbi:MASE1 domain-containing protein [Arenimonas composti]|nr:MASE1 domain-containing protein [Arenimonas composti]
MKLQVAATGDWRRWLLVAGVVLLAWLVLERLSGQLWFLPAGLRLALLWLVPTRRWGWLAAAEVGGQLIKTLVLGYSPSTWTFVAVCVLPWFVYATAVRVMRGPEPAPAIDGPGRMIVLLLTGLIAAAAVSPLLWTFLVTVPMNAADTLVSMFAFLYGDLIGQLVLAPLVLVLVHGLPERRRPGFWRDIAATVLGGLTVCLLLQAYGRLADYVLLLAFAPLFFLGFRHGWEGAAIGTSLLGGVVQVVAGTAVLTISVSMLQLVLIVVGAGALVLGAASTALRESHAILAERHRELATKNDELAGLAEELRQISQRLVRVEEQGQRELAAELDYELGHAIHALGTRISLAFRDTRDEQVTRLLESLREQVREIQDSLRRALRQLRPPMLDSHGLRHALENGPLRDMLDDAGVGFETRFEGPLDALDDDTRTTVYRICQAVVREAVRLETVHQVALHVALGASRLHVAVDIDYSPYARDLPPLQALPAIRDRVLAERGQYLVEPLVHGQRHCVDLAVN